MGLKGYISFAFVYIVCAVFISGTDAWRGNYYTVRYSRTHYRSYCAAWYWWWGCSYKRRYWYTSYYYVNRCYPGWRHNGDQNCNIPICSPSCANGGTCTSPNVCACPTWSTGIGCRTLTCSYQRPCYPGECLYASTCECEKGFKLTSIYDGCTEFTNKTLAPVIGNSNVTLSNIRRVDNRTNFMFSMSGPTTETNDIIWLNQQRFNYLRFEFESIFIPPEDLPLRPAYVHETKLGIVNSEIDANVSKIPRDGGLIRDPGSHKVYKCESGFSRDNPALEIAKCEIYDNQFVTLIEHGDWLTVKFRSDSGGFIKLLNLDSGGQPYGTKYFKGMKDIKQVEFRFDFIAPKHCSEAGASSTCPPDAHILRVANEFTKDPIKVTWSGWTDDLSGILEYYVEVFKLSPDPYKRLIEMSPLKPVFSNTTENSSTQVFPEYRPGEPGMYSVLMETRDAANNTRICRRLVLYDDTSSITKESAPDATLFIGSAVEETGYMWQTTTVGDDVTIMVNWTNHFINHIHKDGMLLNSVQPYPTQFEDIKDDGLLFSNKFVQNSLDDSEGERTRKAIENFHGIIKFEMAKGYTLATSVPTTGWSEILPLAESTEFKERLGDGSKVTVWLRATDVMGNQAVDNTTVYFDASPPKISTIKSRGANHEIELNVEDGKYNYTSRITFEAKDAQSGVHKIGYEIIVHTDGKADRVVYENYTSASTDEPGGVSCDEIHGLCFVRQQIVDVDNCWFMVDKSDLEKTEATVNITAYNQALLSATTQFSVGQITGLKGLEAYSGPFNFRIERQTAEGFRIAWDLPDKPSCYGTADIVLVITKEGSGGETEIQQEFYTPGTSTFFDVLALESSSAYSISFGLKIQGGQVTDTGTSLSAKTGKKVEASGIGAGAIAGVAVAVLLIVAIVLLVFVVLIRRGLIQPVARVRSVKRAVTMKYRQTVHGNIGNPSYEQDDLYIYGGDELEGPQGWYLDRNDITFETLIKSGHFAHIYKANMKNKGIQGTVVAKTLKEQFTPDDEMLMKAKIHFTGNVVGDHPNVLKFIGAVMSDEALGPFIVYEYCEHGTLKEFLLQHKNNVTLELQENLYRFGLQLVKGMEYLAAKKIVHRRLAARNILLTFINEVKIAGFGPQPSEEDIDDAEQGKKERIPIKWMAPECMTSTRDAKEHSDVWSYAVVLWEIYTLGDTPYQDIRSRDLKSRIKKGERLPKPELCDDTWYGLMTKCWSYNPAKRPKFAEIRNDLDGMFVAAPGDDYYYSQR